MRKSRTNFYNSCNNLPIENFYEILNTKNFNWLRIDFRAGDIYDDSDTVELSNLWDVIHEEYIELLSNNSGTRDYTILANIIELERELSILSMLFTAYGKSGSEALKTEIKNWGYYPDDTDKSLKKLQSIQFRISMIKSKNKDLFEKSDEEEEVKIEHNLYSDVVLLEEALGNGIVINVKTTVVTKLVQYIKTAEKKNKKR